MKTLMVAAAFAASLLASAPAWAVSDVEILNAPCSLATGCLFSGNDNDAQDIDDAYAAVFGEPLGLVFLSKYTPPGGVKITSGSWTSSSPVAYISVKAANNFMLYKVDAADAFGDFWTTAGLSDKFDKDGNEKLKDLSHFTLWSGSAVPEPATWAMMIIGFGAAGSMVRRKRTLAAA